MSYLGTLNSLLTSTTSRYASLRRNLTSTSEDDSNISDPEDSHVSRVLRAYYTEKGRPFPAWLGTDPREAARAQQKENPYVTSRPIGSLRGNSNTSDAAERPAQGRGLSDLWSDSPASSGGQSPVEERGSLRRGPLGGRRLGMPPQPQQQQQQQDSLNVRPLPSQRAGSYQTQNPAYAQQQQRGDGRNTGSPGPPPGSSGSGSAQERLKARLGRGSSTGSGGGGGDSGKGGQGQGSYATEGLSGWQGRR